MTTDDCIASETLQRFCLAHPAALLVPAESLSGRGVAPAFAQWMIGANRLTEAQVRCLDEGFARYWQRCTLLYERAPRSWFAPRTTNVLIVTDPTAVVPYVEPFAGTSALLYASDLDTHAEYVAYLLAHNERLPLVRSLRASHLCNLSYWLIVDPADRAAFADAAAAARRPDAAAFVALARAFDWIDSAYHDPLRAPDGAVTEPYIGVAGTDLFVPKRVQSDLAALCEAADRAQAAALRNPGRFARRARSATLDALCDWLRESRAHLVIHAPDGRTLWTAGATDPSAVRAALREADDEAVRSLAADFAVVDARSRDFLSALREPDSLPTRCAVLETGGGAYVDPARRAVVYELRQPGFDARSVPAPPYHRLLLGARVMHEWGHVAHTARYLRVAEERRGEYRAARGRLGAVFAQVLAQVPEPLRADVERELATLAPAAAEVPAALARKTLARVGDYLANMMCARLIPAEEMQAYVRTNVRHHLDEELGLVSELARYAYEVHYLQLAGLPRAYFFDTSRFRRYFIDSGIVGEEAIDALFDAAGDVLACYSIDTDRLALPAVPPALAPAPVAAFA